MLAGYGTGAIMAVPAHDSRDYAFARHFGLEITPVVAGGDISKESYDAKEGKLINSGFLDGMEVRGGDRKMFDAIEQRGLGKRLVNYRLRDAIFSRQRYWGEPFPIYYRDEIARPLPESALPLELPPVSDFSAPPKRANRRWPAQRWTTADGDPLELSTMPGFAGSSAYYLRYMDPHNDRALVGREADEYWRSVDLYVGGIEHATGHLMYSRFWNMFLYDLGCVCEPEPFRKLVNQGMIQGRSNFVYRVVGTNKFVSFGLKESYETQEIHVDVNIVRNDQLGSGRLPRMAARVRRRRVHPRRREIRLRLGDREDVEIDVQRRQPRLYRRPVRRRHVAHVRDVPRPRSNSRSRGTRTASTACTSFCAVSGGSSTPATHWP